MATRQGTNKPGDNKPGKPNDPNGPQSPRPVPKPAPDPSGPMKKHESWLEYQTRINDRGANHVPTAEEVAQYGSYAAAEHALRTQSFSIDEWKKLDPEQLQRNLNTLFSGGGATRWFTEDQLAQLRELGGMGQGAGIYQEFRNFTGTQSGSGPTYTVQPFSDFGAAMGHAQNALANHYASAVSAGDFTSAKTAFSQLQAHNDFMAPAPTYTGPESFSEVDLYNEQQTQ